jgi:hypothetical protein
MPELDNHSINPLVAIGGVAALVDTLMGVIINMVLERNSAHEMVFGISLLLGLPLYLLELRLNQRFAYFLTALFVVRWLALCFSEPAPVLVNPFAWPVGILLFTALAFLQLSKGQSRKA